MAKSTLAYSEPKNQECKICPQCGGKFYRADKRTKYCSKKCQHESMRGGKRKASSIAKHHETLKAKAIVQVPDVELLRMYWEEHLSVYEIAERIGVKHQTLYFHMKKRGIKLRPQKKSMKKGKESPYWKGGKYKDNGYVKFSSGKKCNKLEHRIIAEKALKRPLKENEVVHHINFCRDDNRPSNLLVCTRDYHTWLHRKIDIINNKSLFGRASNE